jgi:hypothetical protein
MTLSALVLSAWWTAVIAVLSLTGFALLFMSTSSHQMMHHADFTRHLQAMWVAFAVAAALIAFFVGRVTRAIAAQREQLANLREASGMPRSSGSPRTPRTSSGVRSRRSPSRPTRRGDISGAQGPRARRVGLHRSDRSAHARRTLQYKLAKFPVKR